jgi:predicted nucleotidyltransferase
MDLREIHCNYVDWILLVQDRDRCRAIMKTVMNIRVQKKAGNFLIS